MPSTQAPVSSGRASANPALAATGAKQSRFSIFTGFVKSLVQGLGPRQAPSAPSLAGRVARADAPETGVVAGLQTAAAQQEPVAHQPVTIAPPPAALAEQTPAQKAFARNAAADNVQLHKTELGEITDSMGFKQLRLSDLSLDGLEPINAESLKPVADRMAAITAELNELDREKSGWEKLVGHFKGGATASTTAIQEKRDALNAEFEKLTEGLGTRIGQRIHAKGGDAESRYIAGQGLAIKQRLLLALAEANEGLQPWVSNEMELLDAGKSSPFQQKLDTSAARRFGIQLSSTGFTSTLSIDGVSFAQGKTLGEGSFGTVRIYEAEGKRYAVKQLKPALQELATARGDVLHELQMHLAAQGNDRVVGLKGVTMDSSGFPVIVLELAAHGTAEKLVQDVDSGKPGLFDRAQAMGVITPRVAHLLKLHVLHESLAGMSHLQDACGILHADFKPANSLIGADGRLKVSDFGTSSIGTGGRALGTPIYMGPEKLDRETGPIVDRKSDNWALGVFAFQLFKGTPMFFRDASSMWKGPEAELSWARTPAEGRVVLDDGALLATEDLGAGLSSEETEALQAIMNKDQSTPENIKAVKEEFEAKLAEINKKQAEKRSGIRLAVNWRSVGDGEVAGVSSLDKFLNAMMHPDPARRPTLSEAMKLSLFDELGAPVGNGDRMNSEALRQLMLELIQLDSQGGGIQVAASTDLGAPELRDLHADEQATGQTEDSSEAVAAWRAQAPVREEIRLQGRQESVDTPVAQEQTASVPAQAVSTPPQTRAVLAKRAGDSYRQGVSQAHKEAQQARIPAGQRARIAAAMQALDPEGSSAALQGLRASGDVSAALLGDLNQTWQALVPAAQHEAFGLLVQERMLDTVAVLQREEQLALLEDEKKQDEHFKTQRQETQALAVREQERKQAMLRLIPRPQDQERFELAWKACAVALKAVS